MIRIKLNESYFEDGFYDGDDGPYKYHVSSYYGTNFSGLEDDFYSNNRSDVEDWIWDHGARGGSIELEGSDGFVRFTPDELEERVELGGSIVEPSEWEEVEKRYETLVP